MYIETAPMAGKEISISPDIRTRRTPRAKIPVTTVLFSRLNRFPIEKNFG